MATTLAHLGPTVKTDGWRWRELERSRRRPRIGYAQTHNPRHNEPNPHAAPHWVRPDAQTAPQRTQSSRRPALGTPRRTNRATTNPISKVSVSGDADHVLDWLDGSDIARTSAYRDPSMHRVRAPSRRGPSAHRPGRAERGHRDHRPGARQTRSRIGNPVGRSERTDATPLARPQ